MAKFQVEEVSPIERRIRIEVDPAVVQVELDAAYKLLSRRVQIPGFRPGRVPRRILEARYKAQVEGDVMQHLVEHSYREAIAHRPDLEPVAPPRVTKTEALKVGEPFRYQANVDIKPKVEPKDYEGLPLKKPVVEITDALVDAEIEKLRQSLARLEPIDGRTVAEAGDFAVVDWEGAIDGKPFAGGEATGATLEIAPGSFGQGNAPELAGAAVSETREIAHTFEKDHRLAELAGKSAVFKVTIKGLKAKHVPPLDDALAAAADAGATLAELKERVRKELTERETEKASHSVREQIVGELIKKNPFDVPRSMIERAIDQMVESTLERATRQGLDPRRLGIDVERLRESLRDRADTEIRAALLLEAISAKEKIAVEDPDLQARIQELAGKYNMPLEKLRPILHDREQSASLRVRIREEKTLAFLESKATLT